MFLTQKNLEKHGWLFSPSLQLMVREHECSDNTWDIEVDGYVPVHRTIEATGNLDWYWEPNSNIFNVYETFEEMATDYPALFVGRDWVDGDLVKMW
jgi:hypothetical protein